MSPTPNRRRLAVLTVASALTLATGLAGAASAAATTDSKASAGKPVTKVELAEKKNKKTKTVKVKMFRFPDTTKVKAGTKVVWKNRDEILHTVSSVVNESGDEMTSIIDGDLDGAGAKYAVSFTQSGTYDYFCMIHPVMKGQIVVKG